MTQNSKTAEYSPGPKQVSFHQPTLATLVTPSSQCWSLSDCTDQPTLSRTSNILLSRGDPMRLMGHFTFYTKMRLTNSSNCKHSACAYIILHQNVTVNTVHVHKSIVLQQNVTVNTAHVCTSTVLHQNVTVNTVCAHTSFSNFYPSTKHFSIYSTSSEICLKMKFLQIRCS